MASPKALHLIEALLGFFPRWRCWQELSCICARGFVPQSRGFCSVRVCSSSFPHSVISQFFPIPLCFLRSILVRKDSILESSQIAHRFTKARPVWSTSFHEKGGKLGSRIRFSPDSVRRYCLRGSKSAHVWRLRGVGETHPLELAA